MTKKSGVQLARSEGARFERQMMRRKLRRVIRDLARLTPSDTHYHAQALAKLLLTWVLQRSQRYTRRAGGL
jgi:hypothetical protein